MDILQVFKMVNQMQADGVIDSYAVGGAVGATFYLEPVATLDVDIFMTYQPVEGSLLISPQPIFDYFKARGGTMEGEYIVVAGTPVQFLPPASALVEEALREAVEKDIEGTPVRVFSAEHLAAIALETNRGKDKSRLIQFIEEEAIEMLRFQQIVERHGLVERWNKFKLQFLADES